LEPFSWSLLAAASGWREVLVLGLPAALMMWGEWWAFETNLFLAGLLCRATNVEATNSTESSNYTESSSDSRLDGRTERSGWLYSSYGDLSLSDVSNSSSYRGDDSSPAGSSAPSCAQLDVSAVVANTVVLAYFFHSGFAWGAAAHVGNLLG
jgi:hypothetical protein